MRLRLRSLLQGVVPPLLWKAASALKHAGKSPLPDWEYCPQGFSDAQMRGWNLARVAESERARFATFREHSAAPLPVSAAHETEEVTGEFHWAHGLAMSWAYALGRAAQGQGTLRVLDWGGGLAHNYLLACSLMPELKLDYHVKDLEELTKVGKSLLPEVTYYDRDAHCFALTYDLVLASGAMHYAHDWRALLGRLAQAASPWLYVTRLPILHTAASYVFVQRVRGLGYDTEYQGWCLNRLEFLEAARAHGLTLEREFLVDESAPALHAPEPGHYRGFLFRRVRALL